MSVNGYYDSKEEPVIDPNGGYWYRGEFKVPDYFSFQPDSQNSWFAGFNRKGDKSPYNFLATKQALDNVQNIRREAVNKQIGNLIRGYGLDGLSGKFGKIKGIAEDAQTKAGAATTGTNKLTGLFNTYKGDQQKLWDQNKQSWAQNSQNWGQNSQKWDQWGNEFNAANKRIDANTNKGGMLSTLLGNTNADLAGTKQKLQGFADLTQGKFQAFNSDMAKAMGQINVAHDDRARITSILEKEQAIREALGLKVQGNTNSINENKKIMSNFSDGLTERVKAQIDGASKNWETLMNQNNHDILSKYSTLANQGEQRAQSINDLASNLEKSNSSWKDRFQKIDNFTNTLSNDMTNVKGNVTGLQGNVSDVKKLVDTTRVELFDKTGKIKQEVLNDLKANQDSWQAVFGTTKDDLLSRLDMTEQEFYKQLTQTKESLHSEINQANQSWLSRFTEGINQTDQKITGTKSDLIDRLKGLDATLSSNLDQANQSWLDRFTQGQNETSKKIDQTQDDLIKRLTSMGQALTGELGQAQSQWNTQNQELSSKLDQTATQLRQADEQTRQKFLDELSSTEANWETLFGGTKEEILEELEMTETEFKEKLSAQEDTVESNWQSTLNALSNQKKTSDEQAQKQTELEAAQKQQAIESKKQALEKAGLWEHIQNLYANDTEGLNQFLLTGQLQNQTQLNNWGRQQQQAVIDDLNQQYVNAISQMQQGLKAQGVVDPSIYRSAEDALRAQRGQLMASYRNAYAPGFLSSLLSSTPEQISGWQAPQGVSSYGQGLSGFAALDPALAGYVAGGVDETPLSWIGSSAWSPAITQQGSGGLLEAALRGVLGG